jgi:hypothetical protein
MQHSVKSIAKNYHELYAMRNESHKFNYRGFLNFAEENMKKYSIVMNGDDLLVSSWYSGELIWDYLETTSKDGSQRTDSTT